MLHRNITGGVALLLLAAGAGAARGDARVSLEIGGLWAHSPLEATSGAPAPGDTRQIASSTGSAAPERPLPSTILGVEFRPSVHLGGGLRVGVGFRSGEAARYGDGGDARARASLFGGDLAVGYQRWFGRWLPFAEARFGFNSYVFGGEDGQVRAVREQLRLVAVAGARVYFSPALYLAASAFGGFGDQYGATVGVGFDILRYRNRGMLP